jgi:ankyrin repeat protein
MVALLFLASCRSGRTPDSVTGSEMSDAIGRRDVATVVALLRNGADPNAEDGFSNLPLVLAASSSSADVVAALLAAGANPNRVAEHFRWTALGAASTRVDDDAIRIVQMLIKAAADVCVRMPSGEATDRFHDLYGGLRALEIARRVSNADVETALSLADSSCT